VGLALTPSSANEPVGGQGIVQISLREITVNLSNPRKSIDEAELDELAQSIRQHGVLQPILVRPLTPDERQRHKRTYQIVIGSRRFHAAERAGLATIDCYVRGFTPDEAVVASFLDHAHHRTLTAAEEAEFLRYLREQRKMRLREIAALINKSIAYVHRRLGHPQLEQAVQQGRISRAAAQEIMYAPEASWPLLLEHAGSMTSHQVRSLVREIVAKELTPAALGRLIAVGGETLTQQTAAPPSVRAAATAGYDPALRQHGPVTHVPASPAFVLLRLVREWADNLPEDWSPTAHDAELLRQVEQLVGSVIRRSSEANPQRDKWPQHCTGTRHPNWVRSHGVRRLADECTIDPHSHRPRYACRSSETRTRQSQQSGHALELRWSTRPPWASFATRPDSSGRKS
jgi:ParB/RepB/Spo0J family partition protein